MAIGVVWQDEEGQVLAHYEGPDLTAGLLEFVDRETICLRFIDQWGDTTFNQRQLPILIEELEAFARGLEDGQRVVVETLVRFVRSARAEVHTYIKFIGE